MNADAQKNKGDGQHFSPFWPVFIVFAVFAILQLLELRSAVQRRAQIKTANAEVATVLPKAAAIEQMVEKVGHDLLALSDGKTNEAAKIISEFNIRMTPPSPPAPAQ